MSSIIAQIVIPEIKRYNGKALDIGCGSCFWGKTLRAYSKVNYIIGLDIWKPYLLKIKGQRVYDDLVLASATFLPFARKSIDSVFAFEVIEHLPRKAGMKFPRLLSEVAKSHVVVSTPNYHYVQGVADANPYQEHLSFWTSKDFERMGFMVKGVGIRAGTARTKYTFLVIPILGRLVRRIIMPRRMVRYADLIACFMDISR